MTGVLYKNPLDTKRVEHFCENFLLATPTNFRGDYNQAFHFLPGQKVKGVSCNVRELVVKL